MPRQSTGRKSRTLQSRGVPWKDNLKGPQTTSRLRGQSQTVMVNNVGQPVRPRQSMSGQRSNRPAARSRINVGNLSPTRAADTVTSGVGILEAEFVVGIILLIMLMFSDTTASFSDKIMSTMKRGTLLCVAFFVLALISSAGSVGNKMAKAFGALIVVSILVTSPTAQVFTALDNLIKNDWVGTDETGNDTSANSGTAASTQANSPASVESELGKLGKAIASAVGIPSFVAQQFEAGTEGLGGVEAFGRLDAALATGNETAAKNALASLSDKLKSAATDVLGSIGVHL